MTSPSKVLVEDLSGVVTLYSDGTISRSDIPHRIPLHHEKNVVWKDFQFDTVNKLNLRLYKPTATAEKLPVVYFLHGGGFCVGSYTWVNNCNTCQRLASGLRALVVAPDYRLAPEHRLPAAVDDTLSTLRWLRDQATKGDHREAWLDGVDYTRVYVFGDSSGGNIAHHLAVRLGPGSPELAPIQVRGYVLTGPFFGGTLRTKSEVGMPEPMLNLDTLDRLWRLSLPIGENADHPLANPFGPRSQNLERVKMDPVLVITAGNELLKDRAEMYANKLQEFGKQVIYLKFDGQFHGFFTNNPYSALGDTVLEHLKHFMFKISG